ncbi:MAG: DUF3089 domain-containing protein [Burkholderiales bacterium]|nr:DUF3089 domain-containing protein [Burkholderiales bacterium]
MRTRSAWCLLLGLAAALRLGLATAAPAPDYASADAWLARSQPASKSVAVFFVHPTSYLLPVIGNARHDEGGLVGRVNDAVLRFQAGAFADCCDLWAPRYRQATLKAITTNSAAAYAVDDLAYSDVARAFDAFLAGLDGRPFILASHSQGSIHALRLLQEKIIGTPLQARMVAAYLVGVALPRAIEARGLPVCATATATRCVVSWNTVRMDYVDERRLKEAVIWWDGRYQPIAGRPLVCVNPLTWQPGGQAPSPGAVSVFARERGGPPSPPVAALERADCQDDGLLGVTVKPEYQAPFTDILSRTGIYHDFDYSLFFASISHNALQRIQAFGHKGGT